MVFWHKEERTNKVDGEKNPQITQENVELAAKRRKKRKKGFDHEGLT